jgi:hypothetical protein
MDTSELRKAAQIVYLVTDEDVARDIAKKLKWAADNIDKCTFYRDEVINALDTLKNLYAIGIDCKRCSWKDEQVLWCTDTHSITVEKLLALKNIIDILLKIPCFEKIQSAP